VCIKSKQESALRNEILAIEREVVGVSVMDEFAKYARLKRRMNKLQLDLMYRGNFILKLLNAFIF
jgi:hypothetical protein